MGLPAYYAPCRRSGWTASPRRGPAQLALRNGGRGLRSAERHAVAAYWASWVDALPPLSRRDHGFASPHPVFFATHAFFRSRGVSSEVLYRFMGSLSVEGPEANLRSVTGIDGLHGQLEQRAGVRPHCCSARRVAAALQGARSRAARGKSVSAEWLNRSESTADLEPENDQAPGAWCVPHVACGTAARLGATATWAPRQTVKPRRLPRFMSRWATYVATRDPASRQMRAAACSTGPARRASMPICARARSDGRQARPARPQQRHRFGANGSNRRRRRSRATRNSLSGTSNSGHVRWQLAPSPLCDSGNSRDAGLRSEKCISSVRLSMAAPAARCHPRLVGAGMASSPSGAGGRTPR